MLNDLHVLIVDDDSTAIATMKRILIDVDRELEFSVAEDGEEALDELRFLRREYGPNIIVLLDLNMPRMNGHEFLKALRADAELRSTVVFVVSESTNPIDVERAYRYAVAGYFTKNDLDTEKFRTLLEVYSDLTVPRIAI